MKLLRTLIEILRENKKTSSSDVNFTIKFSQHQTVDRHGIIDNDVLLDKFLTLKDRSHRDFDELPTKSGVPNDKIKEIIESNKNEFARQYLRFTVGPEAVIRTKERFIKFKCVYYDTEYDCFIEFVINFVATNHERTNVTINVISSAFSFDGKYFKIGGYDVIYAVNIRTIKNNYRNFTFPNPSIVKWASS